MNKIELPLEVQKRCRDYAGLIVRDYASGWNSRSRSVSSHDAESNIELQELARMAECAFCVWLGQSVEGLNWSRHCDSGYDTATEMGRADVKHTKGGRYLIWPIRKNHLFETKQFDVLVLVVGGPDVFEVAGWIPKEGFWQRHEIASEGHKLFPGTWFMDRKNLWPVLKPCDWYDAAKDVSGSFDEAYRAVRERMASGGPGWEPK